MVMIVPSASPGPNGKWRWAPLVAIRNPRPITMPATHAISRPTMGNMRSIHPRYNPSTRASRTSPIPIPPGLMIDTTNRKVM